MSTKLHHTDVPKRLSDSLQNKHVTFLTAPPAYGKSVLLVDLLSRDSRRAIMLIPNKVSVLLLHKYVTKLYTNRKIGYRMSNESFSSLEDDLTLMTTGYFLEWITHNNKVMKRPLLLVIDEAHVSDEQTDSVIRISLNHYRKINDNLKIILSSATLDIERFKESINGNIDIISVPGYFPNVDITYVSGKSTQSYTAKIMDILETELVGINTLIICSGENEIYSLISILNERGSSVFEKASIKPLFSKLDHEEITDALNIKADEWTIIISTNIVESSITIDGVDAVIDTGYRKLAYIDSKGRTLLKEELASKSNIIQALNRCGRGKKRGKGYILMDESKYNN